VDWTPVLYCPSGNRIHDLENLVASKGRDVNRFSRCAWRLVNAATAGGLCPTLGTKQRKRKEREYPLKHDRTSGCVADSESRRRQPGVQETEASAK